jgi:hypothetical protein
MQYRPFGGLLGAFIKFHIACVAILLDTERFLMISRYNIYAYTPYILTEFQQDQKLFRILFHPC